MAVAPDLEIEHKSKAAGRSDFLARRLAVSSLQARWQLPAAENRWQSQCQGRTGAQGVCSGQRFKSHVAIFDDDLNSHVQDAMLKVVFLFAH